MNPECAARHLDLLSRLAKLPARRGSLDRRALDSEQHQARQLVAREVDRLARREGALGDEAETAPRAVGHEYDPGPALDALDAHQPTARITQSGTAPTLGLAHVVVAHPCKEISPSKGGPAPIPGPERVYHAPIAP